MTSRPSLQPRGPSTNKTCFFYTSRPTLLLENYQPWLDLKVPSKVDASVAEVGEETALLKLLILLRLLLLCSSYIHLLSLSCRYLSWSSRTLFIPGTGKETAAVSGRQVATFSCSPSRWPLTSSRDITDDEACVDEVRMSFRFFASVLIRRAQKVSTAVLPSSESGNKVDSNTVLRILAGGHSCRLRQQSDESDTEAHWAGGQGLC